MSIEIFEWILIRKFIGPGPPGEELEKRRADGSLWESGGGPGKIICWWFPSQGVNGPQA